jgi:hypothetical protein
MTEISVYENLSASRLDLYKLAVKFERKKEEEGEERIFYVKSICHH